MAAKFNKMICPLTFIAGILICAALGCGKPASDASVQKQQNLQKGLQDAYKEGMKLPPEQRRAYFLQHAGGPGRPSGSAIPKQGDLAGSIPK